MGIHIPDKSEEIRQLDFLEDYELDESFIEKMAAALSRYVANCHFVKRPFQPSKKQTQQELERSITALTSLENTLGAAIRNPYIASRLLRSMALSSVGPEATEIPDRVMQEAIFAPIDLLNVAESIRKHLEAVLSQPSDPPGNLEFAEPGSGRIRDESTARFVAEVHGCVINRLEANKVSNAEIATLIRDLLALVGRDITRKRIENLLAGSQ